MWYGAGGAVVLLGVVLGMALALSFVRDVAGPLSRFSTARPVELELPAGAERTIYREAATLPPSGSIACQVVEVGTGRSVPTSSTGGLTLTRGSEEYTSVANFVAPRAGRYGVACSADGAQPLGLAVGPRVRVFASVARLFAAGGSALAGLVLGAATVAVTAVKRNRHRRRLLGLA